MGTVQVQETFWNGPEEIHSGVSWKERINDLAVIARRVGGILPRTSVAEIYGITGQSVGELIAAGHLEEINYCGARFISGRSLKAWDERPFVRGRGKKRAGIWKSVVLGFQLGSELGKAIEDI